MTSTAIRFDGDSLTTSWGDGAAPAYPECLRAALPAHVWRDFAIVAVPGQRSDEMLARVVAEPTTLPSADGNALVVVLVGINDLGQMVYARNAGTPTALTMAGVQRNIAAYAGCARRRGWRVLQCTLTAGRNPDRSAADVEGLDAARRELNDWLVANWRSTIGACGLVRLHDDPRIGTLAATYDQRMFSDGVHFTGAGREVVASLVGAALPALG